MSTIDFLDFMGMRPARTHKLLGQSFSVIALNAYLEDGSITPNYAPSEEDSLGKAGTIKTLYRIKSGVWCHWTEEVEVARMPIENNINNRIAFTGTDQPRVTDAIKAMAGGGSNYPEVSYYLGLPAPNKILEAAAVATDPDGSLHVQWDIAGSVEDTVAGRLGRVYTYTYVTPWGEEGPPADPSDIVYANDDEEIQLTNFASAPTGAYQPNMSVRIYRLLSSSAGDTEYLFVDEVALPVTEPYVDNVPDTELGESLLSETWSAPPTGLRGIVAMANGMMAGFVGNDIYLCEPYQGHAWPEDYKRTVDFPIVGLAADGNQLFIMTKGYPYILTGNHPTVVSLDKYSRAPACVSARSIVDMKKGAIYASKEGATMITAAGAMTISTGIIAERLWRLLNPETMHGAYYKGRYVGFYSADDEIDLPDTSEGEPLPQNGMFQIDFDKGEMLFSDETASAAFNDMEYSVLAMVQSVMGTNKVFFWDNDEETNLTYVYRTGTKVVRMQNVEAARVDARSYPVTFRLFAHGVLKHTQTVASIEPFTLPASYWGRDFSVEIEGDAIVDGVFLASDISDLI